jgi:hypothetical protein
MFRSVSIERVQRVFAAAARQKALEEAEAQGWPLPSGLALELWLYAEGFQAG